MDYYSEEGYNLIKEWYISHDETVQAAFELVLIILSASKDWSDTKEFGVLKRRHEGLCESKFKVDKTHYRPVGFFNCNPWEFIFLTGCEKSGKIYKPQDAFDTALDLKRKFKEGKGIIHEHYF